MENPFITFEPDSGGGAFAGCLNSFLLKNQSAKHANIHVCAYCSAFLGEISDVTKAR